MSFRDRRNFNRDELSSIDAYEAVTAPFVERMVGRRRLRRADRRALAVLLVSQAEADIGDEEIDDRRFLERVADWLANPENRQKIADIIAWFMALLDTFGGPV